MIPCEAIINSLEEAIILFDKAAKIIYLNKTAEELFGKSSRDIVGKKFSEIAGESSITPLIKKTMAEGRTFRGKSVSMSLGRAINTDFSLSPLFLQNRTDGAVLLISENINIAEREEFDFDSIDYLIGSIAHEIKNPLGGIKGAAQLLQDNARNSPAEEYADLIIRETDRLNAIVNDYLVLCKKPSFHPVNVHEVLEKAISLMQIQMKKTKIVLKRFYDPSLPQIKGDEAKLLQVFLNLIKNSMESMKRGGKLEISTCPSKESVRESGRIKRWALVSIKDTGQGIEEKDLQKIFIPFFTKKKEGTGIGLALSKKIIKDHAGVIKLKSQKGKGTCVYIYIPFEKNE